MPQPVPFFREHSRDGKRIAIGQDVTSGVVSPGRFTLVATFSDGQTSEQEIVLNSGTTTPAQVHVPRRAATNR